MVCSVVGRWSVHVLLGIGGRKSLEGVVMRRRGRAIRRNFGTAFVRWEMG